MHISRVNCAKMAGDLHMKFSALNVDFKGEWSLSNSLTQFM